MNFAEKLINLSINPLIKNKFDFLWAYKFKYVYLYLKSCKTVI